MSSPDVRNERTAAPTETRHYTRNRRAYSLEPSMLVFVLNDIESAARNSKG